MGVAFVKFIKHAGFTALGGIVAALVGFLTSDPSVGVFVSGHPYLAFVVPIVSGLLGSAAAWLNKQ